MAIKKAKVTIVEDKLIWEFANGKQVSVDPDQFNDEVKHYAMLHGLKQKLSDCYAGADGVGQAIMAFESLLDTLKNGDWNQGRASTGGIFVEALARAAGVSLEEALAKWNAMDEETQKAVKADKRVKLAKAEIEMEKAKKAAEDAEPLEI